ncbi:hypothetical protein [Oceanobacillus damuensis]|uniref:hypothetical protein n=1 Tax=Oceanobacillus damuensis TaxID=937928 RepID=UPI00083244F4|nr:hypothetical protein [Oceanobacillus damuensis]
MDWIFDNLFIIIIIVSALLGFFRNGNDQETTQKEKKRPAPPMTGRIPKAPPERKAQPRAERQVYREGSRKPTVSTASIEEQQKAQMERLANKYNTVTDSIEDLTSQSSRGSNLKEPKRESTIQKQKMKKQVVGNFEAKGLVNGIIMSELLGSPRAKKPYKTVIQDRIR